MKSKLTLILLMLVIVSGSMSAQKLTPAWTAKFQSPINWQRVHSLGYIIVNTNDGLYGVDPHKGSLLWENKSFPALDPANFEEVSGTEFIAIAYNVDKSILNMQAIVNVTTGKILFDSQQEKVGVMGRYVLPRSSRLLVIGVKQTGSGAPPPASLFMFDIASGNRLWVNDDLFKPEQESTKKGLLGALQNMGNALATWGSLTSDPVELEDQTMLITHPSYVFRINSSDGSIVWRNPIASAKKASIVFSPYKPGVVFVGTEVESQSGSSFTTTSSGSKDTQANKFYENLYYAFNIETGAPLWRQPAKEKDQLNVIIPHEKGLIVCPFSSQKPTLNLVDYNSGQMVWGSKGKGIKAQGSVVSYIPTEKGILITTAYDNAWNNKAEEYYLNVIDPAMGSLRYEKSIKLKGDLVNTELVPKGVLFVTTKEINILDVPTGRLILPASIESGNNGFNNDRPRPFPTAEKGNVLFVYSPRDKAVIALDKVAATATVVTKQPVEFEGKELPKALDVNDQGVVLISDQNVVGMGHDGTKRYAKYYPAPREKAIIRALLLAESIRGAYIGAAAGAYSAAFADAAQKTTDPNAKAFGQTMAQGFGELGAQGFAYSRMTMAMFKERFKASQNTPDFVMMMTRQEKKGFQLIQVSKSTGEIMNAVDIKNDREPEYDVDQIFNYIYYRLPGNNRELVCYKL